jgi:hypothetical protein
MSEEASRRFTKRDFAKLRPRRLSKSFNEHRDLAEDKNDSSPLGKETVHFPKLEETIERCRIPCFGTPFMPTESSIALIKSS